MTGRATTFSADVTAPSAARNGFDIFRREWDVQVGEAWPLAELDLGEAGDFRINVQAVRAHDTLIADVYSESFTGRTMAARGSGDRVLVHMMQRGAWRFTPPDGRGETVTVPARSFIARHNGPPSLFEVDPGATARILILPAPALGPLINSDRHVVGSARSPEVRVLTAHANMVGETVRDLTPAGVRGARDALLELVKGVLRREFDDVEPRLAPALARAAMEIADRHLTDPELSPASLARELNVSVRTLHRAFAASGEPVAAYIRRRRLEQARLQLATPHRRPSISEVAAHWQFADSSHFIREFKKHYAQTPAEFARAWKGALRAISGDRTAGDR
ncbi:helix-turn-helix domain-containing protein [Actinoallomurus oryzae]|uniref:Helix-turn-helix domain-containing protein n=1 Tax=Actinoallomurus oryzae TaxID=502180 RepID=A0ABP8QPL5_9ACTN